MGHAARRLDRLAAVGTASWLEGTANMSSIIDIGRVPYYNNPGLGLSPGAGSQPLTNTPRSADGDTVELSSSRFRAPISETASSLRSAWLRAVRAEIAEGTYETRDRINGTVDRLLDVLA
jgi:hypothetical protein